MAKPVATEEELLIAARAVQKSAYAPYSSFRVGVALLGSDGVIYVGCNVENCSYGLTSCAERNAVFSAVARGCRSFVRLVLVSDSEEPVSPCGACRQVLAEFAPDLSVLCLGTNGGRLETTISELLPKAFVPDSLKNG